MFWFSNLNENSFNMCNSFSACFFLCFFIIFLQSLWHYFSEHVIFQSSIFPKIIASSLINRVSLNICQFMSLCWTFTYRMHPCISNWDVLTENGKVLFLVHRKSNCLKLGKSWLPQYRSGWKRRVVLQPCQRSGMTQCRWWTRQWLNVRLCKKKRIGMFFEPEYLTVCSAGNLFYYTCVIWANSY